MDTDTRAALYSYAPLPVMGAMFGGAVATWGAVPVALTLWGAVAVLAVAREAYVTAPVVLRAFGRVAFRAARAAYRASRVLA